MNEGIFFKENDYLLVKSLISPLELHSHLQEVEKKGGGAADKQVEGSQCFYKEEKCEKLLETLLPLIETYTGSRLYKTYSFARHYSIGNVLRAHKDREACEISVTICLGSNGEPWPIWIMDKDEKPLSFTLEPGDGFIFKGHSHLHWREKNVYGTCGQVFLHYVDQNGPYAMHRNDVTKGRRIYFQMKVPFVKRLVRFGIDRVYG